MCENSHRTAVSTTFNLLSMEIFILLLLYSSAHAFNVTLPFNKIISSFFQGKINECDCSVPDKVHQQSHYLFNQNHQSTKICFQRNCTFL